MRSRGAIQHFDNGTVTISRVGHRMKLYVAVGEVETVAMVALRGSAADVLRLCAKASRVALGARRVRR